MSPHQPVKPIAEMSWDELIDHNRRCLEIEQQWASEMRQAADDMAAVVQMARALVGKRSAR